MWDWSDAELSAHWVLEESEFELLKGKSGPGRLAFCLLLKHFQRHGCFPDRLERVPGTIVEFVAAQIGAPAEDLSLSVSDRMLRRFRHEVRAYLDIHRFDEEAGVAFRAWFRRCVLPEGSEAPARDAAIEEWFKEHRFEQPRAGRLARLTGAEERAFERALFHTIAGRLTKTQRTSLEQLLDTMEGASGFSRLKSDPGFE